MSNFKPLGEVVDRGSETKPQVVENLKKNLAGQGLIWYPLMKRDICIKLLFKESLQLSLSFRLHWFLNALFFPWP